jgi:hypothetical protein
MNIAVASAALLATAMFAIPLKAQHSAHVTARIGIASPSDAYQSNCGHSSLAYSLDVQGTRRLFPQFSLDHLSGSGGGDVLCLPRSAMNGTTVGGLRLDGATRLGIGAGARAGNRFVQVEGAVLAGLMTGRRGFTAGAEDDPRRWVPNVGIQASMVLLRYVVLSSTLHRARLPMEHRPASGAPSMTSHSWSPMATVQIGARIRLGSN